MWNEIWKEKARKKETTRADVVARCILRALTAKSSSKLEILADGIDKAFTAGYKKYHRPYYALELACSELRSQLSSKLILGSKELYENINILEFKSLLSKIK